MIVVDEVELFECPMCCKLAPWKHDETAPSRTVRVLRALNRFFAWILERAERRDVARSLRALGVKS